jgi:CheY-like chemotaxis protein
MLNTRHLVMPPLIPTANVAHSTGPLDFSLPWVLEFRVVGTPHVMQTQIKSRMVLGRRSEGNAPPDIDLNPYGGFASGVSRYHAEIFIKDQRMMVRDNGSTNGTFVNGVRADRENGLRLRHGDELLLGRLKMQVSFTVVPAQDTEMRLRTHVIAEPTDSPDDTLIPLARGERLLLVENDAEVAAVLRMVLERNGFNVQVVANVALGLSVILERLPDVLICATKLPDMSGADFVRYLRKQSGAARMPVLIVGSGGSFQKSQALEAGADEFMTTPLAMVPFLRALHQIIQRKRDKPAS